jgi:DNA polymerase III epsilon subunit-like protein
MEFKTMIGTSIAFIVVSMPLALYFYYYIKVLWRKNKYSLSLKSDISQQEETLYNENVSDYTSSVLFVGMDCEMVGVGRHGQESMLARCSLVTLLDEATKPNKVKVLYDAYVKPSKNITDYRTQWSGITKDRLNQSDVITLEECRMNVLEILSSSPDGRVVVLVGHALSNDFDVLKIRHPFHLTRDTAWYRPFMRPTRKRHYSRKLSDLTNEHLGIKIQSNGSSSLYDRDDNTNKYSLGHDSIEDAAAALMLYMKVSLEWEKSLNFPLGKLSKRRSNSNPNAVRTGKDQSTMTLYLDGCNIPLGLRRRKNCGKNDIKYQLITKTNAVGNSQVKMHIDWIPRLHSVLSCSQPSHNENAMPQIGKVCVFFDGKMFAKMKEDVRPKKFNDLGKGLFLEVSDEYIEVDDVLVERCIADRKRDKISLPVRQHFVNIEEVVEDLDHGLIEDSVVSRSANESFVVVKRKGGGSKTNKKLFDKLRLRRAEEGAFCLIPSLVHGNPRLQKNSLQIAKQLQRAKVHQIVEYEKRLCKDVRSVVVTDDVLLSDRIVEEGGVVMSYSQLQQLM